MALHKDLNLQIMFFRDLTKKSSNKSMTRKNFTLEIREKCGLFFVYKNLFYLEDFFLDLLFIMGFSP